MGRFIFTMLVMYLLSSCSNGIHNKKLPFFKGTFLKIEKIIEIHACNPHNPKQCLTKKYAATASSFLVKSTKVRSYLITSAHVCNVDYGRLVYLPNFSAKLQFYGLDLQLRKYDYMIEKVDFENDLCVVSTNKIQGRAYKIASKNTGIGQKVYNIAAPHDIFGKNMVPLFSGYYSGQAHNRSIFTLPAVGGSSGSPILNKKGEVIGVVSAVTKQFKNIVISSTLKSIKRIIKDGVP